MINAKGGVNGRMINFILLTTPILRPRPSSRRASWSSRTIFSPISAAARRPPGDPEIHEPEEGAAPFVSTGASKWDDPKNFPYTIPLHPNYVMEAVVAGAILQTKPDGKIAILYQNDDPG